MCLICACMYVATQLKLYTGHVTHIANQFRLCRYQLLRDRKLFLGAFVDTEI